MIIQSNNCTLLLLNLLRKSNKMLSKPAFYCYSSTCLNARLGIAQSVTCLAADTCLTTDPGVASLFPAWSHTFVEIDREIISTAILLHYADSRRVVVSYKQKYVHKVLVNCLVKLAQKKVWLGELTVQT